MRERMRMMKPDRFPTTGEVRPSGPALRPRGTAQAVGDAALAALLAEVRATPKPGLVDRNNNGSHDDMDLPLFEASARSLRPYFVRCARLGGAWPGEADPAGLFPDLRAAGRTAEAAMFAATGGINTHKGAIFSLGALAAAVGFAAERPGGAALAAAWAQRLCAGVTRRDFAALAVREPRTAGERFYLRFGVTGVRGEAEAGFPLVLGVALPRLEGLLAVGVPFERACVGTLIRLMGRVDDTNVLSRAGTAGLRYVRAEARALERRCGPAPDPAAVAGLDARFTARRISPGGSADLLAAACFLHFARRAGLLDHPADGCVENGLPAAYGRTTEQQRGAT